MKFFLDFEKVEKISENFWKFWRIFRKKSSNIKLQIFGNFRKFFLKNAMKNYWLGVPKLQKFWGIPQCISGINHRMEHHWWELWNDWGYQNEFLVLFKILWFIFSIIMWFMFRIKRKSPTKSSINIRHLAGRICWPTGREGYENYSSICFL